MSTSDIPALRALLDAATERPWEVGDGWVYTDPIYPDDRRLMNVLKPTPFADHERQETERGRVQANATLIVAAVNALPDLLDRLERAEADRDLLREAIVEAEKRGHESGWNAAVDEFKVNEPLRSDHPAVARLRDTLARVEALADALRCAGVEVGSVGGVRFREVVAKRLLASDWLADLLRRVKELEAEVQRLRSGIEEVAKRLDSLALRPYVTSYDEGMRDAYDRAEQMVRGLIGGDHA